MTALAPGVVLTIPEAHYRYGVGPLTLRLTAVTGPAALPGWVRIRGVQIGWRGHDGPTREVDVEMAAITTGEVQVSPAARATSPAR